SAVTVDDALNNGEADARPRIIGNGMQALEYAEEPAGIRHVESFSVIANEKRRLRSLNPSKFYTRLRLFAAEFPGVAQQVVEDQPHEPLVAGGLHAGRYDDFDYALR